MESLHNDVPKLPQMVMCGDHPSVTRTGTIPKDDKEKEKPKDKLPMTYARISPTSSSTDRSAASEHTVSHRADVRRRVLSADLVSRAELEPAAPPDRSLVQAALGSFRWPPYLLLVWVLVLLLTHALHALVAVLEHSIPPFKKFCQYFRTWTEESWKADRDKRVFPVSLALVTAVLYTLYFAMYTLYCVCVWSVEPLCSDLDEETKVTNYTDEDSKTNFSAKPSI